MWKGTLIRLLAYPFSIFIICIGFQMIFDTPNYRYEFLKSKAVISGFGLIIIASVYLITDVIILIKKTFKTKQ